ncbi:thiamine pyrophosphate-binding protein [Eggerthella timonensis]|uniref:thiamine pyrophosphate-binding protein n=1 Tax=Eggerthella timonensis TaxID=1871008 RepID=UPI000C78738B|nr:thiamine pyrophosphate-binding protein [Eggerthella timonensis]
MKAAEYIVDFIGAQGIADVFGYPGGMVTHLMDAFERPSSRVRAHVNLHEQGAAFAACGYAQASGLCGVAFATSGPGATNLLTGVCNAYFDSIPFVAITGQVNTGESKGSYGVRQRGFQETDIVAMAKPVTKSAFRVEHAEQLPGALETAFRVAQEGRPGPVLLDIPMDVQRGEVDAPCEKVIVEPQKAVPLEELARAREILERAKRPCVVFGQGVRASGAAEALRDFLLRTGIPAVSSMPSVDMCPDYDGYHGFLGAYGDRQANFIVAKADVVLVLGARCDVRQVGGVRENFVPNAALVRVDIDEGELSYPVHDDEVQVNMDVGAFLGSGVADCLVGGDYSVWNGVCREIQEELDGIDARLPNKIVGDLSTLVPEDWFITTDVGQNQVWAAQSFSLKRGQRMLFSAGHGAMGYALPAAIGAYYATRKPVLCLTGDGGLQMNIQELAFLAREGIPVNVVVLDNHALGMIRHFQEMYFDGRFVETVEGQGYASPDFAALANAYGIDAVSVNEPSKLSGLALSDSAPKLISIGISEPTYVFPKLEFGKPNFDQEPLLDRDLIERLMEL